MIVINEIETAFWNRGSQNKTRETEQIALQVLPFYLLL